jgi:uncharacterized protein YjbI with pentapeptide repeats
MSSDFYLSDDLSNEYLARFQEIIACNSDNFIDLVKVSKLDLKLDFQGVDLSYVNFSDCDLRNYDFTGADLRGAFGINIVVDETTNFKDANVDSSCFAHRVKNLRVFRHEPEME